MRDFTPTRSAYLELQEERTSMQEGYRFLDEKRLVLVAETLQQLAQFEEMMDKFQAEYELAVEAFKLAVARHGLGGLELYPPLLPSSAEMMQESRSVLGLEIDSVQLDYVLPEEGVQAVNASPEAEAARRHFAQLVPHLAMLAALVGNLVRLQEDYEKTSRRARALEDVLLPEVDQLLAQLDTALEEMDKEEIVRMYYAIGKD